MPKMTTVSKNDVRSAAGRPSKYDFASVPINPNDADEFQGAVFGPDEGNFKAVSAAARQYANNNGLGSTIRETNEGTLVIFKESPQTRQKVEDQTTGGKAPAKSGGKGGKNSTDAS